MEVLSDNMGSETGSKKSPFDDLNREELIKKCKGLLGIAQKSKQAKIELQTEIESYKLQLEKSESEKESSRNQVFTLQELVNSLTEQKLNYITEIDSAQSKVKFVTGTCKKLEEEIANYKSELIVKHEKITEISAQLSIFDSENTSLKRQNKRINEENEQLLNQLTELETKIEEFNQIGLQQREQLQLLEEKVNSGKPADYDKKSEIVIEELNARIKDLELELLKPCNIDDGSQKQLSNYEEKIKEITQLYENEKDKKEKANVKLRSYKDKISKCAVCINQLKNTRYILTKTVKDYSESIPKWQKDIIKASKFLETNINELSNENNVLKVKLQELEKKILNFTGPNHDKDNEVIQINTKKEQLQQQLDDLAQDNDKLAHELADLKPKYEHLKNTELPAVKDDNKVLEHQITELTHKVNDLSFTNVELSRSIQEVETNNKKLNQSLQALQNKTQSGSGNMENLVLQIKSLESEKAILVKEKMNAKDSLLDVENQNKQLANQVQRLTTDLNNINTQYETLKQKNELKEENTSKEILAQLHELKCEKMAIQECYEMLKKEHENQVDLNGLLKDEVETLKLSLEQPKDDNLSDLNVSLQADVVKLENKLSAYKQENASLLSEVKESRAKLKEVNALNTDYEDVKSKLASYKSENTELLNEMKEINQVLKERGEAISKLEKAISEMERLIETLEKDREAGKHEKEKLLKKISSLQAELQNVEQTSNQNSEATKKIIAEKDDANKSVAEKNAIISTLREEIEKLKQHQNAPTALPIDDNMSTSTTSKFEEHSQMKDLDDSFEEKYTKLRIFALKLKKKLNETTVQLQNSEQDKAKLEKIINEQSNYNKIQAHDEVDSPRSKEDSVQKVEFAELEGKVKSLTDELEASKDLTVQLENLKADLAAKCQQLLAETEAHKATQDSLEKARRDVKKRSVLSLEMEDYEKSMKDLTHKMEDNVKKMQQMESTIDTQEGTITAMKTQIKLLEEQIKAEETQNRLTKEELQRVVDESKEKDNIIQSNNEIISKLELDLEDEKRKSEETNFEMTSLFAEKEKVIISLGEEKLELNNRLKKIEFKCADLEEKLKNTNIELEDLKTDYTSYKVRAQAVLRQNQTVDHSQEELLKEETAAMKSQVEVLTAKLNTLQEKCSELQSCCDVERRRASEAAGEAGRAGQRTARLQADLSRLAAQLDAERGQHKLQVSTLTQCYKTQIADLEAKLQKETEELKRQLAEKEKPAAILDKINSNAGAYMLPVIPKEEGSDGEMDINVSMLPREEGEGSESAPSPPLSKSFLGGGNRSPVPLERLLDEGVPEDEALESASLALSPEQELGDVRRKLSAQQERVKHVTLLLAESERECARYAQMNELLKAEVRRARGSLERTEHAHNAEYMKNVTLKFVTLPPGDERSRLVPVLQKILTLTPEETHKINAVAKGMDPNPGKGWGSYLHWPGGK